MSTDVDLASERQRIRVAHLACSPYGHEGPHALAAAGTARVWIAGRSGWSAALTCPLETPFPTFDRFDDGRWLIEGRSLPDDANAIVLTPDGAVIARFKLGDGVSHMGIDASDRIWVGWTDEGIFGNGDWTVQDHEWPPCSNGVACFDPNGALLPLPKWPDTSGNIADCYALNVSVQGAWTCPYTDFPLVHFVPGKPARWWRNVLSGPSAMAVNETHALIAGGYGSRQTGLHWWHSMRWGRGQMFANLPVGISRTPTAATTERMGARMEPP